MFRFLPGILILQLATAALVYLAPEQLQGWGWLRLIVPLLFIACVTAFWFGSISRHIHKDEVHKIENKFAKERESIKLSAERAKTNAVKRAQKEIKKESKKLQTQSNVKVGSAFAVAAGAGALLLITEFLTLGLVLMTTAGGALGGYLFRSKQVFTEKRLAGPSRQEKLISPEIDKN